jgi:hypothetical protein
MASVHSPSLSFKVFNQQGAIVATSMDIYTIVAKRQLRSVGNVLYLATQRSLILRLLSNVQLVAERDLIKLLIQDAWSTAGNWPSYDYRLTNSILHFNLFFLAQPLYLYLWLPTVGRLAIPSGLGQVYSSSIAAEESGLFRWATNYYRAYYRTLELG